MLNVQVCTSVKSVQVCKNVQVCKGVLVCKSVTRWAKVGASVQKCAKVFKSVSRCAKVCASVQVCKSVHKYCYFQRNGNLLSECAKDYIMLLLLGLQI